MVGITRFIRLSKSINQMDQDELLQLQDELIRLLNQVYESRKDSYLTQLRGTEIEYKSN